MQNGLDRSEDRDWVTEEQHSPHSLQGRVSSEQQEEQMEEQPLHSTAAMVDVTVYTSKYVYCICVLLSVTTSIALYFIYLVRKMKIDVSKK